MPSAWPATPVRPPSKVFMEILKPSPYAPKWLVEGMRLESMMRLVVESTRIHNLSSFAPREKPGVSIDTTKADICLYLLG